MKASRPERWTDSRALILRSRRRHVLIVRRAAETGTESVWEFPGGRIGERESPEAGLRRQVRTQLGVELELVVGQPPFEYSFGTHTVVYRYYICGLLQGQPRALGCAEVRWVLTGQLREYVFDSPTQQVVQWLIETGGG
jgi:mutator protein MutT